MMKTTRKVLSRPLEYKKAEDSQTGPIKRMSCGLSPKWQSEKLLIAYLIA